MNHKQALKRTFPKRSSLHSFRTKSFRGYKIESYSLDRNFFEPKRYPTLDHSYILEYSFYDMETSTLRQLDLSLEIMSIKVVFP